MTPMRPPPVRGHMCYEKWPYSLCIRWESSQQPETESLPFDGLNKEGLFFSHTKRSEGRRLHDNRFSISMMPLVSWSQGAAAAPDITHVFKIGGQEKWWRGENGFICSYSLLSRKQDFLDASSRLISYRPELWHPLATSEYLMDHIASLKKIVLL